MKKSLLLLVLFLAVITKGNAQFTQGFENIGTFPAGWTVLNTNGGYTWQIAYSTTNSHTGTQTAKLISTANVVNNDYLVAPQITVTSANNRFSFWYKDSGSTISAVHFDVKLSTTTATAANFTTTVTPVTDATYTWIKKTIDLSAYMGQSVYVAIHATSPADTFSDGLLIDDVVNDAMPTCNTLSTAFTESFDNANCWSVLNGGDSNAWVIGEPGLGNSHTGANVAQIKYDEVTAHDDYLVTPHIHVVSGVNDRITFWVLNGTSSYIEHFDVKVSTSTPTAANFTTTLIPDSAAPNDWTQMTIDLSNYIGQDIYVGFHATSVNMGWLMLDDFVNDSMSVCTFSTPFTQNFDSAAALPNCWTVSNGGDVNTWTVNAPIAGTAHSGSNAAQILTSSTAHDDYLITPRLHIVTGVNDRLSFWVKNLYSGYSEHFDVKLSTSASNAVSFTTSLIPDTSVQPNWTKYTLDLSPYAGQNVYVAIHALSANQYALLLDDVVSDALPQLPPFPQDFDLANTVPNQWKILNTSGTNTWYFPTTTSFTGTNVAMLKSIPSVTQNDLLVTPAITVVAGVNDRFNFRVSKTDSNSNVTLSLSTTNNTSVASFSNPLVGYSDFNGGWALYSVDLRNYVGQTVYIGISGNYGSTTYFSFDNFILDRYVPRVVTDCHGDFSLTAQTPILLNGLDPATHSVIYYSNYYDALQNSNPITGSNIYNFPPSQSVEYFARIVDSSTNAYTTTHFTIFSGAVSLQFQVFDTSILSNQYYPGTGLYNLQWYRDNVHIPFDNQSSINNIPNNDYGIYRLVYTDASGCSLNKDVQMMHLNYDNFTVNVSNGAVANTPSIIANDYLYLPNSYTLNCYMNSPVNGFSISQDGIISVDPTVPPGQYTFDCTVSLFDYYPNITYYLTQSVTIIVPVNGIQMNAFIDNNNNGYKDVGEVNFPKGKFKYIVNNDGVNNVIISPVGVCTVYDTGFTNSYDLSYEIDSEFTNNYSFANITFNNVTIAGTGIQYYNFPITITNNYNDLSVTIVPSGNPRPGFHYGNKIAYTNNGTQTIASGTVTFTKGSGTTISNVSESGIVSTSNGFTFNFTNLLPFETRYITVDLLTATIPTVSLGQLISNSAAITMVSNDVLPLNNTSVINQMVTGSYDPNYKSEGSGGKIVYANFSVDDYLTYTIQFENTGTSYASFVNLTDVLDAKLDENTIRMLDASHVYTLKRVGPNLNWNFANIYLPPSVSGSDIGKGYVTFKIKPKPGYAVGDIIPNSANIYFDYNPAIATNVCTTEFVSFLNNENHAFNGLTYFPNPVKNSLFITNSSVLTQVEITTVLGQKIITKNLNDVQTEIDLFNLENGVYFVKVKAEGAEKTFEIVKE